MSSVIIISLASDLFGAATYLTGTLRRNRKELPKGVKAKIAPGEVLYYRKDSLLTLGYKEKKSQKDSVLLLTTKYRAASERVSARVRRRDIRPGDVQAGPGRVYRDKPAAVVGYNHFMGGVDQSYMMLYAYLDERRTLKFWKKVMFSLIGRMAVNAYILYLQNTADRRKLTRYEFTVKIVEGLSKEHLDM